MGLHVARAEQERSGKYGLPERAEGKGEELRRRPSAPKGRTPESLVGALAKANDEPDPVDFAAPKTRNGGNGEEPRHVSP